MKMESLPVLRGELRLNEPMARYTTWKAGGAAERLYVPADLADLGLLLKSLPADEAVTIVGLGSNLLVRDGGIRGTVVVLHGALTALRLESDGRLYAEAGVPDAKVARFASRHGLVGAEFLAGIPGTVGGALAMNAGCYGAETWQVVDEVLTLGRDGELRRRCGSDYDIGYRHVQLKVDGEEGGVESHPCREEWFAAAWFKLRPGDGEGARRQMKALLEKRSASQPLHLPNAGSVFRNPAGDFAGRLIEACGLKGKRLGGAQISEKHANFIVNVGGATAADIEGLIELARQTVAKECGVELVSEVKIIGVKA
ncbi:MAG: UDP-N-acetylmuramate dehydrogenase [Sulfuricellaceae bacterium]|jgi:UDP-N-acetylmuramate dehydrogenase